MESIINLTQKSLIDQLQKECVQLKEELQKKSEEEQVDWLLYSFQSLQLQLRRLEKEKEEKDALMQQQQKTLLSLSSQFQTMKEELSKIRFDVGDLPKMMKKEVPRVMDTIQQFSLQKGFHSSFLFQQRRLHNSI